VKFFLNFSWHDFETVVERLNFLDFSQVIID